MSSTYRVGQVIYVVMSKEMRVIPLQIIKEVIERTIDGDTTEYIVRGRDEASTMPVSQIEGEVFETSDKARKALIERATTSVHRLVDKAMENAKAWFAAAAEPDMPKARPAKKPTKSPVPPPTAIDEDDPVQQLRRELLQERDGGDVPDESVGELMTLPDGTTARVKISAPKLPQ